MEAYCRDIPDIGLTRGPDPLSVPGINQIFYSTTRAEIDIQDYPDDEEPADFPFSRFDIKIRTRDLKTDIEGAKAEYQRLRGFIQSLGYDTTGFDAYLDSFDLDELRKHTRKDGLEVVLPSVGMVGGVGGPLIGAHASLPDLGLHAMEMVKALHAMDSDGAASSGMTSLHGYPLSIETLMANGGYGTRTPDGSPSVYEQIIMEEARVQERTGRPHSKFGEGLPDHVIASLGKEIQGYLLRSNAFDRVGELVESFRGVVRASRVSDYLIRYMLEDDTNFESRWMFLNGRAAIELSLARTGSDIALSQRDISKARRFLERGRGFLDTFYENVHTFDIPDEINNPQEHPGTLKEQVDFQMEREGWASAYAAAKKMKGVIFRKMDAAGEELEQKSLTEKDNSTEFSVNELTLDQQLAALNEEMKEVIGAERYERAAEIKGLKEDVEAAILQRNLTDPLEFDGNYPPFF